MMDPVHHFCGHDVVLEHISVFFIDQDACRVSQVNHEWKKWVQNSTSLWKRLFAEHKWAFPADMDPYRLYLQHKRMICDLQRLHRGMDAILHPPEDRETLADLQAEGILLHNSDCSCDMLKESKENEVLVMLTLPEEWEPRRVELFRHEDDSFASVGMMQLEKIIQDVQMDDEYVVCTSYDGIRVVKKTDFYEGIMEKENDEVITYLNLPSMLRTIRFDIGRLYMQRSNVYACGSGGFVVSSSVSITERHGQQYLDLHGDPNGHILMLVNLNRSAIEWVHLWVGRHSLMPSGLSTSNSFLSNEEMENEQGISRFTYHTLLNDGESVNMTSTPLPRTAGFGIHLSGRHVIGLGPANSAVNLTMWSPFPRENKPWRVETPESFHGNFPVGDYLLIVWHRDATEIPTRMRYFTVFRLYHIPSSCTVAEVETPFDETLKGSMVSIYHLVNGTLAIFCGKAGLVGVTNAFQH